jgi:hypothetical protein
MLMAIGIREPKFCTSIFVISLKQNSLPHSRPDRRLIG